MNHGEVPTAPSGVPDQCSQAPPDSLSSENENFYDISPDFDVPSIEYSPPQDGTSPPVSSLSSAPDLSSTKSLGSSASSRCTSEALDMPGGYDCARSSADSTKCIPNAVSRILAPLFERLQGLLFGNCDLYEPLINVSTHAAYRAEMAEQTRRLLHAEAEIAALKIQIASGRKKRLLARASRPYVIARPSGSCGCFILSQGNASLAVPLNHQPSTRRRRVDFYGSGSG
ncbi:hypothetical protein B0H16DRAFT_1478324 [Mycena metata]|uniref:Uncharacterized protein n=1 Tax=Mycena metata TaxID=1033252 RepID=A0AAD7H6Y0_9AGAR|nr:hypothetical protein B0H16DRAFT_1478324 [Mycena metata]